MAKSLEDYGVTVVDPPKPRKSLADYGVTVISSPSADSPSEMGFFGNLASGTKMALGVPGNLRKSALQQVTVDAAAQAEFDTLREAAGDPVAESRLIGAAKEAGREDAATSIQQAVAAIRKNPKLTLDDAYDVEAQQKPSRAANIMERNAEIEFADQADPSLAVGINGTWRQAIMRKMGLDQQVPTQPHFNSPQAAELIGEVQAYESAKRKADPPAKGAINRAARIVGDVAPLAGAMALPGVAAGGPILSSLALGGYNAAMAEAYGGNPREAFATGSILGGTMGAGKAAAGLLGEAAAGGAVTYAQTGDLEQAAEMALLPFVMKAPGKAREVLAKIKRGETPSRSDMPGVKSAKERERIAAEALAKLYPERQRILNRAAQAGFNAGEGGVPEPVPLQTTNARMAEIEQQPAPPGKRAESSTERVQNAIADNAEYQTLKERVAASEVPASSMPEVVSKLRPDDPGFAAEKEQLAAERIERAKARMAEIENATIKRLGYKTDKPSAKRTERVNKALSKNEEYQALSLGVNNAQSAARQAGPRSGQEEPQGQAEGGLRLRDAGQAGEAGGEAQRQVSPEESSWAKRIIGGIAGAFHEPGLGVYAPLDGMTKAVTKGIGVAKKVLTTQLFKEGGQPSEAWQARNLAESKFQSRMAKAGHMVDDATAAIKKAYGRESIPDNELELINQNLQDPNATWQGVNPDVVGPLKAMRGFVDSLTDEMLAAGVIPPKMQLKVLNNKGVYWHRSYDAFGNKGYDAKQSVKQDMFDALDGESYMSMAELRTYADGLDAAYKTGKIPWGAKRADAIKFIRNAEKANGLSSYGELTDAQKWHMIEAILEDARSTGGQGMKRGRSVGNVLKTLKVRKDLIEPYRALIGERLDPRSAFITGVAKNAHMLEKFKLQQQLLNMGQGKYFFDPKTDPQLPKEASAQLPDTAEYGPLRGKYTTPEMAATLRGLHDVQLHGPVIRGYMKATSAAKWGETVGNFITQVANTTANFSNLFQQGWLSAEGMKAAGQAMAADFGANKSAGARNVLYRLIKNRVVGNEIGVNEIQNFANLAMNGDPRPFLRGKIRGIPGKAYKWGDAGPRTMGFFAEVARLREADAKRPGGPQWSPDQIDEMAGQIVNKVSANADLVPRGVRTLGKTGVLSRYPGWIWSYFRSQIGTVQQAAEELADPARRMIGARRLGGTLGMVALGATLPALTRQAFGVSKKTQDAIDENKPDYMGNNSTLALGKDKDGNHAYIDAGRLLPVFYMMKPINALLNGKNVEDAIAGTVKEFLEPYAAWAPLPQMIDAIATGRDPGTGKLIYDKHDPASMKIKAAAGRFAETFVPGTLKSIDRLRKASKGEVSRGGKKFEELDEGLALATGVRKQTLDVRTAADYASKDLVEQYREANGKLSYIARSRGTVNDDDLRNAYDTMESLRKRAFDRAVAKVESWRVLGMDEKEIASALRNAGMDKDDADSVMIGLYVPYAPGERGFYPNPVKVPGGDAELDRRAKIMQEKMDPLQKEAEPSIRAAVERYKREHPQGVTP